MISIALALAAIDPTPAAKLVANLIEAAQPNDSVKFYQIAPNAMSWLMGRGHDMTFKDVYICPKYFVGGGQEDGSKAFIPEHGRSHPRSLPAVQVMYECDGKLSVITFAVEGKTVVASELTPAFESTP